MSQSAAPSHRARARGRIALGIALFLGISLAGAPSAFAQGKKGGEWQEPDAGSVPNRFGTLIHVAGTAGNYSMMFRSEAGELRIVELTGGKVPQQAILIRRAEPESKPKADPGQKWKESEAGVIPASFGEIVSFTGTKNNYALIFQNGDGEIRLIDFKGSQVSKTAKRVDRKDPVASSKEPGPNGWKEESIGVIPAGFGPLVAVMGASPQLSFVFQAEDGEIRIVDFSGGARLPQKATKVGREY